MDDILKPTVFLEKILKRAPKFISWGEEAQVALIRLWWHTF